MRFKVIGCEVLARQLYYVAAFSPHVIDIELVAKGLHLEPDKLRAGLQAALDATEEGAYDAVLLGYGLCSNSVAGIVSKHKMVIPRAHDCITLYLGSGERYASEFRATPGTYWYTPDYYERNVNSADVVALGVVTDDQDMTKVYDEYVEKYGKDNADYLMEVMGAWQQHYTRAAYIDTQEMPQLPDYTVQVQEVAARRGWNFERLAGSLVILRDLLEGRWDEERFLIIPPGETIAPTNDRCIVAACKPA